MGSLEGIARELSVGTLDGTYFVRRPYRTPAHRTQSPAQNMGFLGVHRPRRTEAQSCERSEFAAVAG